MIEDKGMYLELLHMYQDAYDFYNESKEEDSLSKTISKSRCLALLGKFSEVVELTNQIHQKMLPDNLEWKNNITNYLLRCILSCEKYDMVEEMIKYAGNEDVSKNIRIVFF